MIETAYCSFESAYPFYVKVPFSEAELYFEKRLKPLIINSILSFEVDYLRLSYKYKLGMPFYSLDYLARPYEYEKQYLINTYDYLSKDKRINFLIKSMKADEAIYSPVISQLFYYKNGKVYSDYIIDVNDFKKRNDWEGKLIIHQPPFDVFGEGYDEKIIDDSQTVNELNYIMFHFGLGSNVFYPFLENKEIGEKIDNRVIAYRNAPRYNSFLRGIKHISEKYGFEFCVREGSINKIQRPYETFEGVLLDGKIIYQEDIDEGRVKIPEIKDYPE